MATQKDEALVTAAALAKQLGVTPAKVKKAIEDAGIQPAKVRCGCSYYSPEDAATVQARLKG